MVISFKFAFVSFLFPSSSTFPAYLCSSFIFSFFFRSFVVLYFFSYLFPQLLHFPSSRWSSCLFLFIPPFPFPRIFFFPSRLLFSSFILFCVSCLFLLLLLMFFFFPSILRLTSCSSRSPPFLFLFPTRLVLFFLSLFFRLYCCPSSSFFISLLFLPCSSPSSPTCTFLSTIFLFLPSTFLYLLISLFSSTPFSFSLISCCPILVRPFFLLFYRPFLFFRPSFLISSL